MDAPGEKLIIRLWETVENGIGGWLSPWQMRRTGRARIDVRREERLALAQTEQDIESIRSGRKRFTADYQLVDGPAPNDETAPCGEIASRALAGTAQRVLLEQIRAEVNVAKALLSAEAELEGDGQKPPDRTVDDDWLFRWRDSAGKVSAEELQILWGRVLAGEIKSPGSFSLRTLEFLKNLSQREARQIEKLAPFVIDSNFVCAECSALDLLESEGITLDFLCDLQELGIVSAVPAGIAVELESPVANEFKRGLVAYDRMMVVTHDDAKKALGLHVYQVTSLGVQILRLGGFTSHDTYLRSVGEVIKRQGFKVCLARYAQLTETKSHYFEGEEL